VIGFLDIDLFKDINDRHGHAVGDQVLVAVARALRAAVRSQDQVVRMGGEEFLLLMPGMPREAASARLDRLRQRITEAARALQVPGLEVTASIGLAQWRPGEDDLAALLRRADHAMYVAKRAGRNRVFDGEELDPPPWHEAQRAAMPDNRAMTTRLNKHIADTGFCSRREADRLIAARRVTVNGHPAGTGAVVGEEDQVLVDGQPLRARVARKPGARRHVYIALNKPVGVTCTTETSVKGNIVDFVGHEQRIFPIGRLDKESEGLILMTSNGDIVNQILRAENGHQKEYLVAVNKPVTDEFLRGMARGVRIHDQMTLPCKTSRIAKFGFRITLQQGLNRQIRLMAAEFGYRVTQLRRVRIDNIKIGALKPGQWRNLTEQELQGLLPKQLDW
jgi:23S rRNA pseudouridine2604 synthase